MVIDLSTLQPGFLPLDIFSEIARLVRLPTVDVILIRTLDNQKQVGLILRDQRDRWWPGMWHLPGTVFRSTDTLDQAIERVLTEELKTESSDTPLFHSFFPHHSDRGAELTLIYTIQNAQFATDSQLTWFPLDDLPPTLVPSEKEVILSLKM